MLFRELAQRSCQEVSYKDLAKRALIESLYRELAKRPHRACTEALHRDLWDLAKRSLAAKRPLGEILHRDLARTPLIKILYRNITCRSVQGSCQEVSYRDFAESYLREILCRDLARRPLIEILHRDVVKRTQILLGDPLQRA